MLDVIADVITESNIRANLYFNAEIEAPYCIEVPKDQSFIRFHLADQPTWIELPDGAGIEFDKGDLVLVPHGSAHLIASEEGLRTSPLADVLETAEETGIGHIQHGKGPNYAKLICGHFSFSEDTVHPIISTLPGLVHVQPSDGRSFDWLSPLLNTLHAELNAREAGYEEILTRLSETIFIQVLRTYLAGTSEGDCVLLSLTDTKVRKVLEAIHNDPGFGWTLERLAETAGMSRSAFAVHFKDRVNTTPMRYLFNWRMQKAQSLLRNPQLSIGDIANALGYSTDTAFSHAFKERFGANPSTLRRQNYR